MKPQSTTPTNKEIIDSIHKEILSPAPISREVEGFTQGEWKAYGRDVKTPKEYMTTEGKIAQGFIHIANTNHLMDLKEAEANAALIASAPTLYRENQQLKRLLHDLTPGGSEFYNDPEYCAKWVKEEREGFKKFAVNKIDEVQTINQQLKKDIELLREALRANNLNLNICMGNEKPGKFKEHLCKLIDVATEALKQTEPKQ